MMCFYFSTQPSSEKPHLDSSGSDSEAEHKMTTYTPNSVLQTQINPYQTMTAPAPYPCQPMYQSPSEILHDYQTL